VKYTLEREHISFVRLFTLVLLAGDAAIKVPVDLADGEYRRKLLALLPADARSRSDSWTPAHVDDWARHAAYRGALDGRRHDPPRDIPTTCAAAGLGTLYCYAYGFAYTLGGQLPTGVHGG